MDKQEIVAALGKLSEQDAEQVIAAARANDRAQRMQAGADALRTWLHPTRPPAEPETPPTPINRKNPTPWITSTTTTPESEHDDA